MYSNAHPSNFLNDDDSACRTYEHFERNKMCEDKNGDVEVLLQSPITVVRPSIIIILDLKDLNP